MAEKHTPKNFDYSASSIQAGLATYAVGYDTAEDLDLFYENASAETVRFIALMVEMCGSAARAYIEQREPELKELEGEEYILVGLQCHLADTWEQWCEEETAVVAIAEQWIAENVRE